MFMHAYLQKCLPTPLLNCGSGSCCEVSLLSRTHAGFPAVQCCPSSWDSSELSLMFELDLSFQSSYLSAFQLFL